MVVKLAESARSDSNHSRAGVQGKEDESDPILGGDVCSTSPEEYMELPYTSAALISSPCKVLKIPWQEASVDLVARSRSPR